jgi:hypothetical protein
MAELARYLYKVNFRSHIIDGLSLPHSCIKKMAKRLKTLVSIELTACWRCVRGINQW